MALFAAERVRKMPFISPTAVGMPERDR